MSYHFGWVPPSHIIGSHTWVETSGGHVPPDAVKAGEDLDGGPMFIGRTIHMGDVLPAKICPNHGCAFVSYAGEEITKHDYQVLCSSHIAWKPTELDFIPSQAIQVGRTADGEALYTGRTLVDGRMTPGKAFSLGVLYSIISGDWAWHMHLPSWANKMMVMVNESKTNEDACAVPIPKIMAMVDPQKQCLEESQFS